MKIKIGNNNKIKDSNIGDNNTIKKEDNTNQVLIDIFVGLIVTVIGGLILYFITKQYQWCIKYILK